MAENDIDAQISAVVGEKKDEEESGSKRKLCVWSQGKTFEFPGDAKAVVSKDHQYLEVQLEVEAEEGATVGLAKTRTEVLGGFLGLWGYKWR